jgi:tetratricopeptide (TPR) repeat protein
MKSYGLARQVRLLLLIFLLGLPYTALPAEAEPELDSFDTIEQIDFVIRDRSYWLSRKPEQARLYVERGNAYFHKHEFDKAVADFSKALELDEGMDIAYFGRGLALGRLGEIDSGILDLSEYIRRHPNSSLAYTKRGVRYLWLGEEDSAERDLSKAIQLDSRNAEAHDDLGVILARRGHYSEAISHFVQTVQLDSSYQKGYHNLAMAYYLSGDDRRALTAVNQALRLSPQKRDSLLLKSHILESLGRTAEARTMREDAEFLPEGNWSENIPVN